MLDGLDEVVSRTDRSQVRQQVEDLVHDIYPRNQVLVTAREAGYREDAVFGDDFVRLDVQRLDDEQIRTLVGNWCVQLYPGEAEPRTDELVQAIQEINELRTDRDLPPLVSTPLLTTMVVSVKWGETELPRERAKLYEACVKVILQAQYVPDDPARQALVEWGGAWEDQRNWLATLALAMHEGGRASAAIPEVRVREVLQRELAPTSVEQFLDAHR
jgi:predicted NACHT family NTPase